MNPVTLLDTGPWVAALNPKDDHHRWAVDALARLRPPLLTCDAVVAEACHLLRRTAAGASAVLEFIARDAVQSVFDTVTEARVLAGLMKRYADVPMSFADACLVRMAELHAGATVFTLDSDFRVYRVHGRKMVPTLAP